MTHKAIDVALVFHDTIRDKLVAINQHLVTDNQTIDFSDGAIPHLTLAQVLLSDDEIQSLQRYLESYSFDSLEIDGQLETSVSPRSGNVYTMYVVSPHVQLIRIHEDIMHYLQGYYPRDVHKSHFLNPHKVMGGETGWVAHFYQKYAFDNYNPHITLGRGVIEGVHNFPRHLPVKSVIIGCLANNGTIREIIYQKDIHDSNT